MIPTEIIYIFYHRNCSDGSLSNLLLQDYLPKVFKIYPISIPMSPQYDNLSLKKFTEVFNHNPNFGILFVDVVPHINFLKRIKDSLPSISDEDFIKRVHVIDHHESNKEVLESGIFIPNNVFFDTRFSACELTWKALGINKSIRDNSCIYRLTEKEMKVFDKLQDDYSHWLFRFVGDKDLGYSRSSNKYYSKARSFFYGSRFGKYKMDLETLFNRSIYENLDYSPICRVGTSYIKYFDDIVENIAQNRVELFDDFFGYRAAVIFGSLGEMNTPVMHYILDHYDVDVAVCIVLSVKFNNMFVSIRSRNGEALKIASSHGGGGHPNAAAFKVKIFYQDSQKLSHKAREILSGNFGKIETSKIGNTIKIEIDLK